MALDKMYSELAEKGFLFDSTVASLEREVLISDSVALAKDIQFDACAMAGFELATELNETNNELLKAHENLRPWKVAFGGSVTAAILTFILYLLK